jgi:type I restriction enzyme M protein
MSLNTQSLQPIINFLWTVADDVLVNTYQKGKYKDVILPMVVIRRLDLLLEPTKEQVLQTFNNYKDKLQNLDSLLTNTKHGSGLAFYNTSPFTLKKLLQDPKNLRSNFENYLNGFSENVQDIIKQFKFRNEIETLDEADILFSLIEKFCSPKIELHPDRLPPLAMGYVYEDLVRRFNEENNEEAGEHFTPREIIDLMTHLVFTPAKDKIKQGTFLVYDPCVGSGGMLTIAKNFMLNADGPIKSNATVHLYGQESTPFIYATCKSDMLIKGEDPNKIAYGSTLSAYGFEKDLKFDFMLTNPPYGKTWAPDKKALGVGEKGKIIDKRFILKDSYKKEAVTSRVNDGQLMFVLHMLSKMKDTELGSRIASVHNGSALFTGDAGQGESEIRKYIIENDLLEAIIALPNDMFYNTGIPTYIFLITNRKAAHRKGKVQLINATSEKFYYKMRKPLGKKRVEFSTSHIPVIEKIFIDFEENEYSKIFDNIDFGYAQITVHRPLRLMVQFTPQKVVSLRFVSNNAALREKLYKEFGNDVYEKKTTDKIEQWLLNFFLESSAGVEAEEDETEDDSTALTISSLPKKKQKIAKQLLDTASWQRDLELHHHAKTLSDVFDDKLFNDFNVFSELFDEEIKKHKIKLTAKDKKDIINAIGWTDPEAEAVIKKRNKDGSIEYVSDPALRDYENIPLKEDIQQFFEKEVLPFASDAWWDESENKIGYEINFAKYFYIHQPPRPLSAIAKDIFAIEEETEGLLKEIIEA